MIGGGIYTLLGAGVLRAGPAVLISFLLGAIASLFAALAYAELGSMVPVAGSAYTYAYATMGQLVAWIIGWDLILEYDISVCPTAQQFSAAVQRALESFGLVLPHWAQTAAYASQGAWWAFDPAHSRCDIIAALFLIGISMLLALGVKESAVSNNVMVIIKIGVLVIFMAAGLALFHWHNLVPFAPLGWGKLAFGASGLGIIPAAALVFWVFGGFDMVTTAAEESRVPSFDVPFGVIGSLVIGTIVYCATAFVMVGITPWHSVDETNALGQAVAPLHNPFVDWSLTIGIIVGTTSVSLSQLLCQARILFVMGRDGMLPPIFAQVHPRFRTPAATTLLNGVVVALISLIVPIDALLELVNIGIFTAFIIVCGGVIWLRYKHPELPRPFRSPFVPLFPILGIVSSLFLSTVGLGQFTWLRFCAWLVAGIAIYFAYGYHHARADLALGEVA
jgi:APA family basic amino acid/polyamine antiporter